MVGDLADLVDRGRGGCADFVELLAGDGRRIAAILKLESGGMDEPGSKVVQVVSQTQP